MFRLHALTPPEPANALCDVQPLAVDVAGGRDERADTLHEKARWYLADGVGVVWILLPAERVALVATAAGETRHHAGERLPAHPELPGLEPEVADLFRQVSQQG